MIYISKREPILKGWKNMFLGIPSRNLYCILYTFRFSKRFFMTCIYLFTFIYLLFFVTTRITFEECFKENFVLNLMYFSGRILINSTFIWASTLIKNSFLSNFCICLYIKEFFCLVTCKNNQIFKDLIWIYRRWK